jgi:cation transport protein ChaC
MSQSLADTETDALWIFGYGSLMWRPGFAYTQAVPAVLVGYQRLFCIYSTHHRGTAERPGLVLGLDQGGTCHGLAFRITEADRQATLSYLRAREQINGVYREVLVPLQLQHPDGGESRTVLGVTYVVERAHPGYAGHLPLQRQARIIRSAVGLSGPNIDYLANTTRRAQALGLPCQDLERLLALAGPYFADRRGELSEGATSAARALLSSAPRARVCPRQPGIGERRRFHFRRNREAARDFS